MNEDIVAGAVFIAALIAIAAVAVYWLLRSDQPPSYDEASRQQAREVSASVDRLLSIGTIDQLRRGIEALEAFARAMDAFHGGRVPSPGDAELRAALAAGIAKLNERVSRPVVAP